MVSFESLKAEYERNWANLQIRPSRQADATAVARRALNGKATYQQIEKVTDVPWQFIAMCHYRESNFDFDTYLGNGETLRRVTSLVPKGRGPFASFADGAVDALRIQGFVGAKDWGVARTLFRLEAFNGFGYHAQGVNSPYLYGGSTLYGPTEARAGKYIRDHVFDPNVNDPQLGTAVVLHALMALDPSIKMDGTAPVSGNPDPDEEMESSVTAMQQALNKLGADPQLVDDGISGPRTKAAVSRFQQQNGLKDTGLLDGITIAAITRATTQPVQAANGDLSQIMQKLNDLNQAVLSGGIIPAVTTPAVTTPSVTTPSVTTPAVTTPAGTTAGGTTAGGVIPGGITPAVVTPGALPVDLSQILGRLENIAQVLQPGATPAGTTPTVTLPGGQSIQLSQVLNRLEGLAQVLAGGAAPAGTTPAITTQPVTNDPLGLLQRLFSLVNKTVPATGTTTGANPAPTDQLKQVVDLLSALLSNKPVLGQVNGALGETIGNLLNGKKTALGTFGALITSLLSSVTATPGSGGIAGLLGTIANAVPGLSQFALPISLALAAWGVLGKMEKWAQGTAPPPKPTS
jgi:lysozyme family protein/peptidoglycan hydrolase-like protein with peptidoglycan-binding domain